MSAGLWRRLARLILLVAIVAAAPLVAPSYMISPLLVTVGLNVMVCMALSLAMGYAGLISLGHGAFFGVGAYASALLAIRADWPAPLAVVGAVVLTALMALLVAGPTLRLKGHYLAVATLGIALVAEMVMIAWSGLTGGPDGLNDIPALWMNAGAYPSDLACYAVVWTVVFLAGGLMAAIVRSPVGLALRALRDDELAARCLGSRTSWLKTRVFVFSAAVTALAGALYAHLFGAISPAEFNIMLSVRLVPMLAIGGITSLRGAAIGAVALSLLPEALSLLGQAAGRYDTSDIELLCYALILVAVMILWPGGIVGALHRLRRRHPSPGHAPGEDG